MITVNMAPLTGTDGNRRRLHVVVVGAGGIGARVLPTLIKMLPTDGTASVTVVDHDIVEPKNLRRQPFVPENVGTYKAVVMQERYSTTDLPVTAITEPFEYNHLSAHVGGALVILGCVDNTKARWSMLSAISQINSHFTAYLDAGNDGNRGQVIVAFAKTMSRPNHRGSSYHNALSAVDKFPDVFCPEDPKAQGCDLLDTQTPMANLMAATFLLQYLSLFLHGQILGSAGVTFSTLGATDRIPLIEINEARGYKQFVSMPKNPDDFIVVADACRRWAQATVPPPVPVVTVQQAVPEVRVDDITPFIIPTMTRARRRTRIPAPVAVEPNRVSDPDIDDINF